MFDISSDWYNGYIFISEGNPIWGTIVILLTCMPMAVWYLERANYDLRKADSTCEKIKVLLRTLVLAVPRIAYMTAEYIFIVIIAFVKKCL